MSDHEPTTITRGWAMWRVICRCGWVSGWADSEDAAEAEHELHVELSTLTPDDFDVGGDQ